jgi:uncharacterized protein (DUF427 family)
MWQQRGQSRPEFASVPLPGQESVWDYPRPPVAVREHRLVQVRWAGRRVAESRGCYRVLETASPPTVYIPPADVDGRLLAPAEGESWCEWKGAARYWSLRDGTVRVERCGWSYPAPTPRFGQLAGYLSFYPGLLECLIDGERVQPQPGGFYGGWITAELAGPFKGEPGTGHW